MYLPSVMTKITKAECVRYRLLYQMGAYMLRCTDDGVHARYIWP